MKPQLLGLLLAFSTAVGCIFYEKLVTVFGYHMILTIILIEYILLFVAGHFVFGNTLQKDLGVFVSEPKHFLWAGMYICTGITGLLWFYITKNNGVMVGSVYEVKFILMLSLFYVFFGEQKFTINTGIGICLALVSIYFISKK